MTTGYVPWSLFNAHDWSKFNAPRHYGKAALKKLAPLPENFRLYSAGWLGKKPEEWSVMEVTGAQFRVAKSGPNKGKLSMIIPGTKRTVFVTSDEMKAAAA